MIRCEYSLREVIVFCIERGRLNIIVPKCHAHVVEQVFRNKNGLDLIVA